MILDNIREKLNEHISDPIVCNELMTAICRYAEEVRVEGLADHLQTMGAYKNEIQLLKEKLKYPENAAAILRNKIVLDLISSLIESHYCSLD